MHYLELEMSKIKIAHVTPHLGGGVGRCLSSICLADDMQVERKFILLEQPLDKVYYSLVAKRHQVDVIENFDKIIYELHDFDIIQIEFWNHPAIMKFLDYTKNLRARRVFWCHVSGVGNVTLGRKFLKSKEEIIFSSNISNAYYNENKKVVNSGFVSRKTPNKIPWEEREFDFLFAGQLDFAKLHKDFHRIIEAAAVASSRPICIFGDGRDSSKIKKQLSRKLNVQFYGHVNNLDDCFSRTKFLIYPLSREHYGTGENILKEAMSLGCVPLTLDNLAENDILREFSEQTCHKSVGDLINKLRASNNDTNDYAGLSKQITVFSREQYSPTKSVLDFSKIYIEMIDSEKRIFNSHEYFGSTPRQWYEAFLTDMTPAIVDESQPRSKGSRVHFSSYFKESFY